MAIGTKSSFTINDELFEAGYTETLVQNTEIFNAASRNSIQLIPQALAGEYEKFTYFDLVADLVARRDPTSVAAVTDTAITDSQHVSVKLNRKMIPVAMTLDSWNKKGVDADTMSVIIGQQFAKAVQANYVNTALLAVKAAITDVGTTLYKDAAGQSISHGYLNDVLRLMGDASQRVVCWVMHSAIFHDLVGNAINTNVTNIADVAIFQGSTGTFNRPVLITDSSSLITATTEPDTYHVLGLTEGAIEIKESEEKNVVTQLVTGLENLALRIQGEYAFNLGLKGYAYQTGQGANPTDATLGATGAWSKISTSIKDTSGVMLNVRCTTGVPTV